MDVATVLGQRIDDANAAREADTDRILAAIEDADKRNLSRFRSVARRLESGNTMMRDTAQRVSRLEREAERRARRVRVARRVAGFFIEHRASAFAGLALLTGWAAWPREAEPTPATRVVALPPEPPMPIRGRTP